MAKKQAERRKAERRTTPPMVKHCETICKPVDEKLDDIWVDVKNKTSNKVFWIISSALAFVSVVLLGGMLWSFKDTLADLNKTTAVTNANLITINQSINSNADNLKELKGQVKDNIQYIERKFEKLDGRIETLHNNGTLKGKGGKN